MVREHRVDRLLAKLRAQAKNEIEIEARPLLHGDERLGALAEPRPRGPERARLALETDDHMLAGQLPGKFQDENLQPARSHPLDDVRDAISHGCCPLSKRGTVSDRARVRSATSVPRKIRMWRELSRRLAALRIASCESVANSGPASRLSFPRVQPAPTVERFPAVSRESTGLPGGVDRDQLRRWIFMKSEQRRRAEPEPEDRRGLRTLASELLQNENTGRALVAGPARNASRFATAPRFAAVWARNKPHRGRVQAWHDRC